jgi:hypothetical protein
MMATKKMDPEIKALKTMHRALMSVDLGARKRMLEWAWSVYFSDAITAAAKKAKEQP